jgi:bifunctional DNA-binding transcriptional regulator/antitoxin component of YhaV-PrlF toxin-antitoxin module
MKIGIIIKPNEKGQIVIPLKVREQLDIGKKTNLNIVVREDNFVVYPIREIHSQQDIVLGDDAYLELLKRNLGAWGPATKDEQKKEDTRAKLEQQASKRRRQAW